MLFNTCFKVSNCQEQKRNGFNRFVLKALAKHEKYQEYVQYSTIKNVLKIRNKIPIDFKLEHLIKSKKIDFQFSVS